MPVRQIPKNFRSLTGRFASSKNSRGIAFESSLERDLATLLEFDPRVVEFEEQPLHIPFRGPDGKPHIYTPDFRAVYRYRDPESDPIETCIVEVKYRSDLWKDWAMLRPSFKAAVAYATARGWHFKVLTEKEIRAPFLAPVQFFMPFLREEPDEAMEAEILRYFMAEGPRYRVKARDVYYRLNVQAGPAQTMHSLWRLVATGYLRTNYMSPLTAHSLIWLPDETVGHYIILPLALPGLYRG